MKHCNPQWTLLISITTQQNSWAKISPIFGGRECETFASINKSQSSQKLLTPDLGEMEVVDEVQVVLPVGDFGGKHQVYQEGEKYISRESWEWNEEIGQFHLASHTQQAIARYLLSNSPLTGLQTPPLFSWSRRLSPMGSCTEHNKKTRGSIFVKLCDLDCAAWEGQRCSMWRLPQLFDLCEVCSGPQSWHDLPRVQWGSSFSRSIKCSTEMASLYEEDRRSSWCFYLRNK